MTFQATITHATVSLTHVVHSLEKAMLVAQWVAIVDSHSPDEFAGIRSLSDQSDSALQALEHTPLHHHVKRQQTRVRFNRSRSLLIEALEGLASKKFPGGIRSWQPA